MGTAREAVLVCVLRACTPATAAPTDAAGASGPSPALGHLLGRKFHDADTVQPESLYLLAALLVREQLVSVERLYPHLR